MSYRQSQSTHLHVIVSNASVSVEEAVHYDSFYIGVYGHNVILLLHEAILEKINIDEQASISETIKDDLLKLTKHHRNEFIHDVVIQLSDENNRNLQSSEKLSRSPIIPQSSLDKLWKPDHIKLFISHRDTHKAKASELGEYLNGCGVSSFIAHHSIEPLEKWKKTILDALKTMDVMLVFITDGFFESCWTNQEIGFALGRETPIISLKLNKDAPEGFIQDTQALAVSEITNETAETIYELLIKKLKQPEKIKDARIAAFINSANFNESIDNFKKVKKLETIDDADIEKIIKGFEDNTQLHNCSYFHYNRKFLSFLKDKTGKDYKIENSRVQEA
jgi:hypothetical protein